MQSLANAMNLNELEEFDTQIKKLLYCNQYIGNLMQKKLTQSQKTTLKKHSKHHSKKHMSEMKKDMKKGKTFGQAHKTAMKKVGK